MSVLHTIDQASVRSDLPEIEIGDTVRVHYKIQEGSKTRIQVFEGVVIKRRGSGMGASFCVRKISFQVGVERVFPLHSPLIDKVEVVNQARVRRAKLYYLRNLRGRAARLKPRNRQ